MAEVNIDHLSDEELEAMMVILGERAQEISDATSAVRQVLHARSINQSYVEAAGRIGSHGQSALKAAASGAPKRAEQIAAERQRVADEEEAAAAAPLFGQT